MKKMVENSGYTVIVINNHDELKQIFDESIQELQDNSCTVNWFNFKINENYFNDNCDMLKVTSIDNSSKTIVLEVLEVY